MIPQTKHEWIVAGLIALSLILLMCLAAHQGNPR